MNVIASPKIPLKHTYDVQPGSYADHDNDLLKSALTLIDNKQYVGALAMCLSLADKNDIRAASLLDLIIIRGSSNTELFCYCDNSCNLKSPATEYALGFMYNFGFGVDPNLGMAVGHYEEARGLEFPWASNRLGYMYLAGHHQFPKDYKKAYAYLQEAYEYKIPASAHNLGVMFYKGYGVNIDYYKAFDYFKEAYNHGLPDSAFFLSSVYTEGLAVRRSVDMARSCADQGLTLLITKAQTSLEELFQSHKDIPYYDLTSSPSELFSYGMFYLKGKIITGQSHTRARQCLEAAYKWGHPEAAFQLGQSYRKASFFSGRQDDCEAEKWYRIAAKEGTKQAQAEQILNKHY